MDFTHPHFAEPRWLWIAVAGPVLLLLLQRYAAWARRRQLVEFAAPDLLPPLLRSHNPVRRWIKEVLLLLAVAGIGLALARPQWGETLELTRSTGEDLLILLDCSRSMMAPDVRPNRLTRAKLAVLDLVQRHGRGRVGLIAFAGQAFLQCPLTFDYEAFREALMAVDERTIPVPGTDLGRALAEGFAAMEKNERRKIMVLVTDGEDLQGAGVNTAKKLTVQGCMVFAIGIGTPSGSPILVANEQGVTEPVRDRNGQVVQSRLDEETLRAVTRATGGIYQPLGTLGEGMSRLHGVLMSTANRPSLSHSRKLGVDRFHIPIAVVLFLLVSESLIGTRRRMSENRGD